MRPLVRTLLPAALLALAALAFVGSGPASAAGGDFDSGRLFTGATYSHTFDEAGTFPYRCTLHAKMDGTLTVDPEAAATGNVTVRMLDNRFDPATLTIAPGTTVTWINEGRQPHDAVSGDSSQDHQVPALAAPAAAALLAGVALLLRRRAR